MLRIDFIVSHEILLTHLYDFSPVGFHLPHHIPTKPKDPSHAFSTSSSCFHSQGILHILLLASLKPKFCHLYRFTFTSLTGPPSNPVLFINSYKISILLPLFLCYYFKCVDSPIPPFTVKHWEHRSCNFFLKIRI